MCRVDWREVRATLGLRQEDVARICHVSPRTVRYWESRKDHRCPSRSALALFFSTIRHPRFVQYLVENGRAFEAAAIISTLVRDLDPDSGSSESRAS